jgi:hypothetical protein
MPPPAGFRDVLENDLARIPTHREDGFVFAGHLHGDGGGGDGLLQQNYALRIGVRGRAGDAEHDVGGRIGADADHAAEVGGCGNGSLQVSEAHFGQVRLHDKLLFFQDVEHGRGLLIHIDFLDRGCVDASIPASV